MTQEFIIDFATHVEKNVCNEMSFLSCLSVFLLQCVVSSKLVLVVFSVNVIVSNNLVCHNYVCSMAAKMEQELLWFYLLDDKLVNEK